MLKGLVPRFDFLSDYYDHVKFPMDMKTMGERLKANYYVNKRLFIADMKRMITNCKVCRDYEFHLWRLKSVV